MALQKRRLFDQPTDLLNNKNNIFTNNEQRVYSQPQQISQQQQTQYVQQQPTVQQVLVQPQTYQQPYQQQTQQIYQCNYQDIDNLPNEINLEYYGINTQNNRIKYIVIVRFSTYQEQFKCTFQHQVFNNNNNIKKETQQEQLIILQTLNYQNFKIEHNVVYRIITNLGVWFCKLNDVDRIMMVLCSSDFALQQALYLFAEIESKLQDKSIMKIPSGSELIQYIEGQLNEICTKYETQVVVKPKNQSNIILQPYLYVEYDQEFSINLRKQSSTVQKIDAIIVQDKEQNKDILDDDFYNSIKTFCFQSLGPCLCLLMFILVAFLIYWFIIRNIISPPSTPLQKHLIYHKKF